MKGKMVAKKWEAANTRKRPWSISMPYLANQHHTHSRTHAHTQRILATSQERRNSNTMSSLHAHGACSYSAAVPAAQRGRQVRKGAPEKGRRKEREMGRPRAVEVHLPPTDSTSSKCWSPSELRSSPPFSDMFSCLPRAAGVGN